MGRRLIRIVATACLIPLLCCTTANSLDQPTTRPARMRVRVIDADTAEPLSGVRVYSEPGMTGEPATTDLTGFCTIDLNTEYGWVGLHFNLTSYQFTQATWSWRERRPTGAEVRTASDLPQIFELRLPRGRSVEGRVFDELGVPIVDARVHLSIPLRRGESQWPNIAPSTRGITVRTDGSGSWRTTRAPEDLNGVRVAAFHDDFLPKGVSAGECEVIELQRGARMSGRVIDSNGKPLANVDVSATASPQGRTVTTKSGADGEFRLPALAEGSVVVIATAEGHAPELVFSELRPDSSIELVLKSAHSVLGRVVDSDGKPVANAELRCDEWRGERWRGLTGRTGADGRFEIGDAPADPMRFTVSADGFSPAWDCILKPDKSTTVRLAPRPLVHLHVVDAASGTPLEQFRVVAGSQIPPDGFIVYDYRNRPLEVSGSRAETELSLNYPGATKGIARVEAPGYRPWISPPLAGRGPHELNVQLEPAPPFSGILLNPDRTPAGNANVRLLFEGMHMVLQEGEDLWTYEPTTKTDGDGRFQFPAQLGPAWVVAIGNTGWEMIEADRDGSGKRESPSPIVLRPWSRIEGKWPVAPATSPTIISVSAWLPPDRRDGSRPQLSWASTAKLMDDGSFVVDHLPDFHGKQIRLSFADSGGDRSDSRWVMIRIQAGETTRLERPGSSAVDVHGRLQIVGSPGQRFGNNWIQLTRRGDSDDRSGFACRAEATGEFRFAAVPPGDYEICASTALHSELLAIGSARLTIPSDRSSVDLGTVDCHRSDSTKVGALAPHLLGTTVDGRPIRTEDYRGRWIVVVSWGTTSGHMQAPGGELREVARRFAGDGRVALIGLNFDPALYGTNPAEVEAQFEPPVWIHGYVGTVDWSLQSRLGAAGLPHIVIISPEGRFAEIGLAPEDLGPRLIHLLATPSTQPNR